MSLCPVTRTQCVCQPDEGFHCPYYKSAIAEARREEGDWKAAIDSELTIMHSTADSYSRPHDAVKALVRWNIEVALDPRVSSDAEALIERGRREEREECAKLIERGGGLLYLAAAIRARGEAGVYTQEELDAADKRAKERAARLRVE